jgi:hypothetical protein
VMHPHCRINPFIGSSPHMHVAMRCLCDGLEPSHALPSGRSETRVRL